MSKFDLNWILARDEKFRYQLLDRMRSDCAYFLGCGNRQPQYLWAGNEKEQIETMKAIWHSFPEEGKPEWLTLEQIEQYEADMMV